MLMVYKTPEVQSDVAGRGPMVANPAGRLSSVALAQTVVLSSFSCSLSRKKHHLKRD